MKLHELEKLQHQGRYVGGRYIVGIDPAKAKHEAQILDPEGLPVGSSFSFTTTHGGFHERLWRELQRRRPAPVAELPRRRLIDQLVFAVEASCNLWPTLVHYLEQQGGRVVIVSPLSTCHARPAKSGNFSRTDSKDAFLIAGAFDLLSFHPRQDRRERGSRRGAYRTFRYLRKLPAKGTSPLWLRFLDDNRGSAKRSGNVQHRKAIRSRRTSASAFQYVQAPCAPRSLDGSRRQAPRRIFVVTGGD